MEVYLQLTDFIKFLKDELFHINLYGPPAIQIYDKSPNFENQPPRIRLSNLRFTLFDLPYMSKIIDKIWEAHLATF